MGTKPCQATCPQGISLAWSFKDLDSSFPKGHHHLQRTHSSYPEKQGNWGDSSIPSLNSQKENLPKARTKGTPESTSPVHWENHQFMAPQLCNKLLFPVPFLLSYNFTWKRKQMGAFINKYLLSIYHVPHTLPGARDRAEKTGKDSCPHREDKHARHTTYVICYMRT